VEEDSLKAQYLYRQQQSQVSAIVTSDMPTLGIKEINGYSFVKADV